MRIFILIYFAFLSSAQANDDLHPYFLHSVESMSGKAIMIRANGTQSSIQANSILKSNDRIITSEKSYVDLRLGNGSVIRLGPSSSLKIKQISINDQGLWNLNYELSEGWIRGYLKSNVSSFHFNTMNATMNVDRSEFIFEYASETKVTKVHSLRDEVKISKYKNEKLVLVKSGFTAKISSLKQNSIKPVEFSDKNLINTETKKTFYYGLRKTLKLREDQGRIYSKKLMQENLLELNKLKSNINNLKKQMQKQKAQN